MPTAWVEVLYLYLSNDTSDISCVRVIYGLVLPPLLACKLLESSISVLFIYIISKRLAEWLVNVSKMITLCRDPSDEVKISPLQTQKKKNLSFRRQDFDFMCKYQNVIVEHTALAAGDRHYCTLGENCHAVAAFPVLLSQYCWLVCTDIETCSKQRSCKMMLDNGISRSESSKAFTF